MKRYAMTLSVLLLLVFGAVASGSAMAQHRHFGHGGVRFGVSLGVPLFWPGYYPYYYPPYGYPAYAYGYPAPAGPSAYVEQGVAQAAPAQPAGDWYYCADSKSYYPYVRECAGGWQRVPAQPSR